MELFTKIQVQNLLLKQRKNCYSAILKNKKNNLKSKTLAKVCLNAKVPAIIFDKPKSIATKTKKSKINWVDVLPKLKKYGLTPRESQVLVYMCEAYSTRQIANKLRIAEKTTEAHRHNVYVKMKVTKAVGALNIVYSHIN